MSSDEDRLPETESRAQIFLEESAKAIDFLTAFFGLITIVGLQFAVQEKYQLEIVFGLQKELVLWQTTLTVAYCILLMILVTERHRSWINRVIFQTEPMQRDIESRNDEEFAAVE
jgi:glycerol-3-phosphate acyltransferase PlsY